MEMTNDGWANAWEQWRKNEERGSPLESESWGLHYARLIAFNRPAQYTDMLTRYALGKQDVEAYKPFFIARPIRYADMNNRQRWVHKDITIRLSERGMYPTKSIIAIIPEELTFDQELRRERNRVMEIYKKKYNL